MSTLQAALTGALLGRSVRPDGRGLSVTWGMLRVINLAHFGMILLGAYLTYPAGRQPGGVDPILTLVVTVPALVAARGRAAVGVRAAGLGGVHLAAGQLRPDDRSSSRRSTTSGPPTSGGCARASTRTAPARWSVGPARSAALHAARVRASAVVLIGGGHLALQRTFTGRAMRAFAEDRQMAAAFGIDHRRLGHAGRRCRRRQRRGGRHALRAGQHAGARRPPYEWFGIVFAVVILGGIGQRAGHARRRGAGRGAVRRGLGAAGREPAAPLVLFLAIVLALLLRPQGLFPADRVRAIGDGGARRWPGPRRLIGFPLVLAGRWRALASSASQLGMPAVLPHPAAPPCCSGSPRPPAGTSCPATADTSASARARSSGVGAYTTAVLTASTGWNFYAHRAGGGAAVRRCWRWASARWRSGSVAFRGASSRC